MEPPSTPGNVEGDEIGTPFETPRHELPLSPNDDQNSKEVVEEEEENDDEACIPNTIDCIRDEKVEEGGTVTTASATQTTTSAIVASSSEAEGDQFGKEVQDDNDEDDIDTRRSIAPVQEALNLPRQIPADTITEQKHDSVNHSTDAPPKTPVATSCSAPETTATSLLDDDISNNRYSADRNNNTNEDPNEQEILQSAITTISRTVNSNDKANANPTASTTPKANASKTLAALFGGPSIGNAPGVYSQNNNLNTPAAQHDYTLVGDSPYDTTYDPQSPYYYNRVFGQLYITTISVMFRGKAFGPIGAIPYERRLLLPFLEVSRIDAFKTTSIKITMNDDETYVFKSFENRDDVVRLLRRTMKKCCDENQTMFSHQHQIDDSNTAINRSLDSSVRNDSSSSTSADEFQEHGRESRESRSLSLDDDDDSNNPSVRQQAQFMPSSLPKQPETAGALPNLSRMTPRHNSLDTAETQRIKNSSATQINFSTANETTSNTPKKTSSATPSQLILPNTLRLSMHGDEDSEDLLEEKKDAVGDSNRPRRLFETESTSSTTAPVAAVMMLSPPRTTISKRHVPKTPGVVVVGNSGNVPGKHNQQQVHRGHQTPRGRNSVAIPIPTVPSLNTPELQSQKPTIKFNSQAIRGTAIPLPIPEIDNDDPSPPSSDGSNGEVRVAPRIRTPVTPVANPSSSRKPNKKHNQPRRDGEQDIRLGPLWRSALRSNPKTQKDWQVALEPTRLANCDLDDWFDLFFSDDSVFSLARYQLEHIGDRDVSLHPWRTKSTAQSKTKTLSEDDDEHDGVPVLEREISYIHPIGGKIGPSEAETFRFQTLKRYGSHGAILENVTTVGKSIPMGDCFRVEDRWIIEQETPNSLKLSVDFRVVFVKRTMFKGIIQKNTLSETKEWFQGYSKMLQAALESPERQELQRRKQQQEHDLLGGSVSVTSPSSAQTLSTRDSANVPAKAEAPVSTTNGSPRSDSAVSAVTTSQKSDRNDAVVSGPTAAAAAAAAVVTANPPLMVAVVPAAIVVCLQLVVVVALWFQVRSLGTSLSVLEGGFGKLQAQNAMLLQKLEELGVANQPPIQGDPGTVGAILLQE